MKTLKSERIIYIPLNGKIFKDVFPLFNTPAVLDTMGWNYPLDEEEQRSFFKKGPERASRGEEYHFILVQDTTEKITGMCSLLGVDKIRRKAELGYWLVPEARGKGLAFEASRFVMDFAFGEIGLHKLWAETLSTNKKSGSLLLRLGFKRVGILRKELFKNGEWRDRVVYDYLPEDDACVGSISLQET